MTSSWTVDSNLNYINTLGDGRKPLPDDVADGNHIERAETAQTHGEGDYGKYPKMNKVDEFGAHAKADPREITLVKKLDQYIIVCF